ncbi:MAG: alanine--tRNA ligase [Gammaproteobacteria bacterium]|nr:alanine--tRNA ligase [Gammaproteobacteria bacterium]
MKTANDIRRTFLDYFKARGHEVVPSSPLVPANDPTLLFTNAGMVQFKDVFLGQDKRPYSRAASSQRCVRAGGKHNDLENVGYTARHHTFFEMLGNFSFGDYFKDEAIRYAWGFLTEELGIPAERLWVTVYQDDDEAADIWLEEIGVAPERFGRIGDKPGGRPYESDNFWSMGDTGPCGPCSEIFYDHGPDIPGGPPGSLDEDGDRYIEIWNLVFMQYDRDANGHLNPLPAPSVDTGMGLERLAALLQGVHSNYEIDTFVHLITAVRELAPAADPEDKSLRVIADHIRSGAFLIADGVVPANEGRGYVLRRIVRRAIRHGHRLGLRDPFFHRLVAPLAREMGDAYPELHERREIIERVLKQEETRFAETLDQGMAILEQAVANLEGEVIPGDVVFQLYDTYGFPVDLTADVARERGLTLDMAGFEADMAAQRQRARASSRFTMAAGEGPELITCTDFIGYDSLEGESVATELLFDGATVDELSAGTEGGIVLETTPFYAESGGQVGDRGRLRGAGGVFEVRDTQKQGAAFVHLGRVVEGRIGKGDRLNAEVDADARYGVARNHSATHLLHAALRDVLGDHVQQKGSLVQPGRLRFDFSHFEPLSAEQVAEIERRVNAEVLANAEVQTRVMSMDDAMAAGALALFGEKYGDRVRVLSIGDFSTELCGGTHVSRSGDIGLFKIVAETGVAAGVRRIEAISGHTAVAWAMDTDHRIRDLAGLLRADQDTVEPKLRQLLERQRELEKTVEQLTARLASSQGGELSNQALDVGGIKVLAAELEGADSKTLRDTVDQLKNKLGTAAVVLAAVEDGKVRLVAGVSRDATDRVKAGALVNFVAQQVGGKGGGRPDMAQAGGSDAAALPGALGSVADWVREQVEDRALS